MIKKEKKKRLFQIIHFGSLKKAAESMSKTSNDKNDEDEFKKSHTQGKMLHKATI